MEKKLLSIIIPAYNIENYISVCLDSILQQNTNRYEIIIINDGSTDSTPEIINGYILKNKNIISINKKNEGASSARNDGINSARGEYIYFIDGDDVMVNGALDFIISIIEKYPEKDLYYGNYLFLDNKPCAIEPRYDDILCLSDNMQFLKNITETDPMCVLLARSVYNRSTIIKAGINFDHTLSVGEDLVFFFQYVNYIKTILTTKMPFYYYRSSREGSLTSKQTHTKVMDNLIGKKYFYDYYTTKYDQTNKNIYKELKGIMSRYYMSVIPYINKVDPHDRAPLYSYVEDNIYVMDDAPNIRHKLSKFIYKAFGVQIGNHLVTLGFKLRVWLANLSYGK